MRDSIPFCEYVRPLRELWAPEYRHVFLLLYWPLEVAFFALAGRLNRVYHPIICALDAQIPFLEGFFIPYVLWFACLVFLQLYTIRYDIPSFRRFMYFMIVNILLAGAVFLLYPTRFPGRPVEALGWPATVAEYYRAMPRQNILTWIASFIFFTDPPANCFPSEHVAVALGMAATVLSSPKLRRPAFSVPFVALQLLICLSVVYTKQHSVLDVVGAIPVFAVSCVCAFVPWKKLRARSHANKSDA